MLMRKRTICVVTGTRAEYGLLSGLMKEIREDSDLKLQTIVTGMHLSPLHGLTYRAIEQDGFVIDEKIDLQQSGDTAAAVTQSVGRAVIGFADAYQRLQPDIVVILGDRTEALAAAQAALIAGIPIAHLHGGEVTQGAIDDAIRHAITKMAHLHFVAAEPYRQRVIQLGEPPDRVYNLGALGIENIKRLPLLDRPKLETALGIEFGKLSFLVTYHPATNYRGTAHREIRNLIEALDAYPEARVIATKPNSDAEGQIIIAELEAYATRQPDRVTLFDSLGQINYLSAMRQCDVVIGNSSSGIIEAPSFHKPTVNIGPRQEGRLKAASIIDCGTEREDIVAAIRRALSEPFQSALRDVMSPYGSGETSKRIKDQLKSVELETLTCKRFYDVLA